MSEEDKLQMSKLITDRLNEYTLQLSEHLAQTVKGAVETTVNGKINKLTTELNTYIQQDNKWKEDLTVRVDPALQAFEQGQLVTRIVIFCAKALGYFGAGIITFFGVLEGYRRFTGK